MTEPQTLTTVHRRDDEAAALAPPSSGAIEIAQTRVAQEVQAAMLVAKKFKRNEDEAQQRIEKACCRVRLAEMSQYHFPRGKEEISGPTIRLAEVLAQSWGNIDYGTIELEQRQGESLMMAYCWDLETNVRSTKMFVVPHIRERKDKRTNQLEQIALDGARDIYEMTANMGARRVRSCILSVIPRDVQETALDICNQVLSKGFNEEKRDKMIEVFQEEFAVTLEQLETFIGRRKDKFDGGTYVRLRRVYSSLKDGFAGVQDFFPPVADTAAKPRGKFGFNKNKTPDDPAGVPDTHADAATDAAPSEPGTAPSADDDDAAVNCPNAKCGWGGSLSDCKKSKAPDGEIVAYWCPACAKDKHDSEITLPECLAERQV